MEVYAPVVIVCGFNFTFGAGGKGNGQMLKEYGKKHGFRTVIVPEVVIDGETVSSTRIRRLLAQGDMHEVNNLLGRGYSIAGRVEEGKQVGRTIGFLTANITIPPHKALPENTASPEARCEMVRRLTADRPWAQLDTLEIDRGGASYTVDTLRALHGRGETDLYLIIGTDMLLSFDRSWRAPDEIARLATLAVCARENEDWDALREKAAQLRETLGARIELVPGDSLTVSSTELRQGGDLHRFTAPAVADYIEREHLYGF